MPKFYVNIAKADEISLPVARVSIGYYRSHLLSMSENLPLLVAKITHGQKSCCVQIRSTDKLYLRYFLKNIIFPRKVYLFLDSGNENEQQIIFLSENYRRKLDINDICTSPTNMEQFEKNIKEINIDPPKCLLTYLYYLVRACYNQGELYSFTMFILTLLGGMGLLAIIIDNLCKFYTCQDLIWPLLSNDIASIKEVFCNAKWTSILHFFLPCIILFIVFLSLFKNFKKKRFTLQLVIFTIGVTLMLMLNIM